MQFEAILGLAGFALTLAIGVLALLLWSMRREVRLKTAEAEQEAEKQGITAAKKVVGHGWVLEQVDENNYVLHTVRITSDGWAVSDKSGKSWLVRGIRPQYVEIRRYLVKRLVPMWIADREGNILEVEVDGEALRAKARQLPPELSYAVINSKLLSKVARVVAQDYSLLMYGMFLGLGLAVLVILVVLPAMGVPVQIGAKPIDIKVTLPSKPLYELPPPGNYTPG
ncbi:hypothetical protein Pyrde_0087 [Pyrodictium delaneyi]|uniref:Uncharacterized protein n=1 Tax=Pyrodictium delaneyi TaxID=1273541 RepID=A0A0N7JCR6_9CREN|nr:hypothetical protein [Pyrodictium delaneyi]ALL00137.1 hypothetical protein Pyrde_0087 [Pyrodictium delaneyi]OWJ54226.1 hypothetical protein Pdsh_06970 [Pyrodictium delaneyi]